MRTLYVEGLAIHDDLESCVGGPRGRSEALKGCVQARLLSREIKGSGVPTLLCEAEGKIAGRVIASCQWAPRGRRTGACT
jgi:hypothetical protein